MMSTNLPLKATIKKMLFGVSVLAFLIVFIACGGNGEPMQGEDDAHEKEEMHEHEEEKSGLIELSPESIKAANIEVETVSLRSLKNVLQVTGRVYFNENKLAHIGSRVPGRIVRVIANPGDVVKEGASLAVIDSVELGEAQSDYLKARANLAAEEKSFERAKKLLDGKAISLGEYQKREAEYITVRAESKAAEDRLQLLGTSKTEISRSGEINSTVSVRAPFAGTIVERDATVGEVIEPATKLFTLADLSTLWVIADVPEKDIAQVKSGLSAEVKVSAYPNETFTGVISYAADVIDPSTRTMKVRLDVDNSLGKLKPEMFASVGILTEGEESVLAVPESALLQDGDNTIVFIAVGENTFEKRVVAVGAPVSGLRQVLSGIKPGEAVVTEGAFILKSELQKGEMDGHGH